MDIVGSVTVDMTLTSFGIFELTMFQVLQREIAQRRGINVEQLNSAYRSSHHDDHRGDEIKAEGQSAINAVGKRKYRRHPKVPIFVAWCSDVWIFLRRANSFHLHRPMRTRLKDHPLPTSSSRIVSVFIHVLVYFLTEKIRNTRRIETREFVIHDHRQKGGGALARYPGRRKGAIRVRSFRGKREISC